MRLFVAVWPTDEVVRAVVAVASELRARADAEGSGAGVRWTRPDQWHVTMRFLGSVHDDEVDSLRASLAAVAARSAGGAVIEAVLEDATSAFCRSVLVVPVAGLGELAAAVVAATAGFGEAPEERPFSGHLTLARARPRDRRGRGVRACTGAPVPAMRWTVGELTLVRSVTSAAGATHEIVGRWPLGS
ncbi:MAG TPA: RNA 2',3'-cyclic phosphodiesterase [Acidimicrobiales bacterium]